MFIVGFLNAIYVEISLYENKNFNNKNLLKNPEKANSFYEKIVKYIKDENYYTLFDYLIDCPFLSLSDGINGKKEFKKFSYLNEIDIENEERSKSPRTKKNTAIKKDFMNLSIEEQLNIIKLHDFARLKNNTIATKIRLSGYKNVMDNYILDLMNKLKG